MFFTADFSNFFRMTLKNMFLFLFLAPIALFAQRNTPHVAVVTNGLYPMEAVPTFDLRSKKEVKRVFLIEDWSEGKFLFSTEYQTQQTFPLKYDILNQELNVNISNSIVVAPLSLIKGFKVFDGLKPATFLVLKPKGWNKSPSFFELLVDGEYKLLVHHYTKILPPNYNPALNSGSKNSEVKRKKDLYLLHNGIISEVSAKKKKAKKFFAKFEALKDYFKQNDVKFNHQDDFVKVVEQLNKI